MISAALQQVCLFILLIYNKMFQKDEGEQALSSLPPYLFLSFSPVCPVNVQPAVDIIPGVDLVFLEAAAPLEGSQGGK